MLHEGIPVKGLAEALDTLENKLPKVMRKVIGRAQVIALRKVIKPAVIAKISMYGLVDTGRLVQSINVGRGRKTSKYVIEAIAGVAKTDARKRAKLLHMKRTRGSKSMHSVLKEAREAGLNFAYYAIPLERGFMLKMRTKYGKEKQGPARTMFVPGFNFFEKAFNENVYKLLDAFVAELGKQIEKELSKRSQYR